MAKYTFDDFMKAMQDNGLTNNFSDADIRLAQKNPDAGMSILNYKLDVKNAKTPEQIAMANAGAEQIRSSYGGYTAGSRGEGFYLNPMSPGSFDFSKAPTYENRYDQQISDMLDSLLNRPEFSYDPETDQLYSQYKKQYNREGDRATAEALGAAAAASGGIPSSYAATAASQAGNYYASQLTDKIPELYQLAYNQYLSDYNMDLTNLDAVRAAEQSDYTKYLNSLNQWNADREFEYGKLLDEVNQQTLLRKEALEKAGIAASMGDFSMYEDMGIDTANNPDDWERKYTLAVLGAQYGDYSGLRELGINPSTVVQRTALYSDGMDSSDGGYDQVEMDDTTLEKEFVLTNEAIETIRKEYGSKLRQYDWDALKEANPGLTDEMLKDAGFSIMPYLSESDIEKLPDLSNGGESVKIDNKPGGDPIKIDMNSVMALGYGPLSADKLDQLVASGAVEEYVENGMIKFRRRYA